MRLLHVFTLGAVFAAAAPSHATDIRVTAGYATTQYQPQPLFGTDGPAATMPSVAAGVEIAHGRSSLTSALRVGRTASILDADLGFAAFHTGPIQWRAIATLTGLRRNYDESASDMFRVRNNELEGLADIGLGAYVGSPKRSRIGVQASMGVGYIRDMLSVYLGGSGVPIAPQPSQLRNDGATTVGVGFSASTRVASFAIAGRSQAIFRTNNRGRSDQYIFSGSVSRQVRGRVGVQATISHACNPRGILYTGTSAGIAGVLVIH